MIIKIINLIKIILKILIINQKIKNRFDKNEIGVRLKGVKRILFSSIEFVLFLILHKITTAIDEYDQTIFENSLGARYLFQIVFSYLAVRVFLNGILFGLMEIIHGDGIFIDNLFHNLAFVYSLRKVLFLFYNHSIYLSILFQLLFTSIIIIFIYL